jgi:hypothetical protein
MKANLRTSQVHLSLGPITVDANLYPHDDVHIYCSRLGSFSQTGHLQIMYILLHILLIAAHLALLGVAKARKEHNIVFSIDDQQTVSFSCKVATMAFGTVGKKFHHCSLPHPVCRSTTVPLCT